MKQKGFGLISLIILVAVIFALLNVYAYYNPSFSLSKYSPLNFLKAEHDKQRVKDLQTLQTGIENYYNDKNTMPGSSCGRISGVLHPGFISDIESYLPHFTNNSNNVPSDPIYGNSDHDYFYYRYDNSHYLLMAVMELSSDGNGGLNGIGNTLFSHSCHDWPGNDIYNYKLTNLAL